ncbi:glycoside hydrolase family 16 protein [Filobasidium floriforme]|uniref:glycoside hydrolase family 16 protein n=1 Tax=Filobasidium floriforme TaxID=5210 RepID=UPI001E8CC8D8|nr:glycoside hydrolase family 16 protein [Filobasidium floriforme]KAH8080230.1 glycoside hydrolase family 16 protein [Filobasidium floriforme]
MLPEEAAGQAFELCRRCKRAIYEYTSIRFNLSYSPASWNIATSPADKEPDDWLHNPDPRRDRRIDHGGTIFTLRGLINGGCILVLAVGLIALFAGWPIAEFMTRDDKSKGNTSGAYNLGGINATGQRGTLPRGFGLIDSDTPQEAYFHTSLETGEQWELVFSDEFEREGRTFWEGDDPFWEAENYHYWTTNNLEWYDPRAVTTEGGSLKITLSRTPNHGLNYTGGLINSWNKFCFTGGYVEASISLPGTSDVYGLWPAFWLMGNLARPSYGGTTDGMWPYSYDTCDIGTLPNQTLNGKPEVALTSGSQYEPYLGSLSYLIGQRFSACTCPDDPSHPGPKKADGTWKARSAPELDIVEAQVDHTERRGQVSQSGQFAPFNAGWYMNNISGVDYGINDDEVTKFNTFNGNAYQQSTSGLAYTNQDCYTGPRGTGCLSKYGAEYETGGEGYIRWVNDGVESWWMTGSALRPDPQTLVGQRLIPEEPMYLILNLGISPNFGAIDYEGLEEMWPVHMLVDYVRVYQDPKKINVGCDPEGFPTTKFIADNLVAFTNPNISTYDQIPDKIYGWPKNRLIVSSRLIRHPSLQAEEVHPTRTNVDRDESGLCP